MGVWMNITFVTLVDKLYEVIGVDKNRFDLEFKVVYKCDGRNRIPIPVTKITTDSDLEICLEEMSYSIQNYTPLCVSILPKLTHVGEGCSQNALFVPETGAEKIDELKEYFGEVLKTPETTTRTSSSRVHRVRIVNNEAKWSTPLFSEGELLQETPDNLSVGSSNSVKIVIGQLFENKEDLKLKLHLHTMKCNFEFKRKYTNPANPNYAPRSIIDDFSKDYGINMIYENVWRCREKVLLYVRGTINGSYQKLPSYLYMLEKTNLGTVTHLETDEIGHFKYFFMSLGASIRGFRIAYVQPPVDSITPL
ncbi:hypothetical protein PanWU01x14_005380 [Parasponia andersonii]|uniref:Uncharacterized protein n=1 Tax=Parasponia andersonii TaxID=3476 RepID=A0A2P5E3H1_PARAD|nr:hypothetical protein PanWU01x14_005380 [Parasponia andersonii]